MLAIDYSLWPPGTLWIQVANFLLLLLLLNILLYRPIRRILSQRNNEVNSLLGMIEDYQDRSEKNEKHIEENKVEARKEGLMEKEDLKGQGLEEERMILQGASSSAEEKIGTARKETEIKVADVRKALEGQVAAFSKELTEKILGRGTQ